MYTKNINIAKLMFNIKEYTCIVVYMYTVDTKIDVLLNYDSLARTWIMVHRP